MFSENEWVLKLVGNENIKKFCPTKKIKDIENTKSWSFQTHHENLLFPTLMR